MAITHAPPAADSDDLWERAQAAGTTDQPELLARLASDSSRHVRQVALSNPICPPETLAQAATDPSDRHIAAIIAENPNTPADVLASLGGHPHAGVRHQVAIRTDQPELLARLASDADDYVRQVALSNSMCPSETLAQAAAEQPDGHIVAAVAGNPNTPADVLTSLGGHASAWVRSGVARNPNCPAPLVEQLANDEHVDVVCEVLRRADCSAELLEEHSRSQHPRVLAAVADNPSATSEVLTRVAHYPDRQLRRKVRQNPNCPKQLRPIPPLPVSEEDAQAIYDRRPVPVATLQAAATGGYQLRAAVAAHAKTPVKLLQQLASDSSLSVRTEAIANQRCPMKLIRDAANAQAVGLRNAAARHPKCPKDVLEELARDTESSTRLAVAIHPNCPPEALESLIDDDDRNVRHALASSCAPQLLDRVLAKGDTAQRQLVLRRQSCPSTLLAQAASDANLDVRATVAAHPNTSIKVLRGLAKDPEALVRRFVVRNDRCPDKLRGTLIKDPDDRVRAWVAEYAGPQLRDRVLTKGDPMQRALVLSRHRHNDWPSPETLTKYATDPAPEVRASVAYHLSTPADALSTLATGDDDDRVRAAAMNAASRRGISITRGEDDTHRGLGASLHRQQPFARRREPVCGKIVKSTGLPCLIRNPPHRGNCRSI